MNFVFLNENGAGDIYDEEGNEAMDIVDEVENKHNIRQLVNYASYKERNPDQTDSNNGQESDVEMTTPEKSKKGRSKEYNNYSDREREKFFEYKLQHLLSTRAAALKANIKRSTAYNWWDEYLGDPDNYQIGKKTERQTKVPNQLTEEHKRCLIDFFDENPQAYIKDGLEELTSKFGALSIKKTRLHEFMKEECNLSFKKVAFWPEGRSKEGTIGERLEWVKKWSETDMDFAKNCVFIDESGFDINMKASRGWGPKGKTPIVTTKTTRAISHSIIGCISPFGVINVSIRLPKAPAKIRKVQGGKKRKAATTDSSKDPKGTTAGHYLRFIKETLDVMDKYDEFQGFYFIMDNASIHQNSDVKREIESRGREYKCVYLPPYSPELNPIEQFWALIKKTVKRHKLDDSEMLEERIKDASHQVPIKHLQNIIQHSKDQFVKCLDALPI
jgi:transposase